MSPPFPSKVSLVNQAICKKVGESTPGGSPSKRRFLAIRDEMPKKNNANAKCANLGRLLIKGSIFNLIVPTFRLRSLIDKCFMVLEEADRLGRRNYILTGIDQLKVSDYS